MNYPLISEYIESIMSAEDNFFELSSLRPVLDESGNPIMSSGNFAVVFKMQDGKTGKFHAVKCFLKEQEGRSEAYKQIADELEFVSSNFLTPIKYYERELFVDSANTDEEEFPILLMDWVEGVTLDKFILAHIDDSYELAMLAYKFSRLAIWLLPQSFAHGDLKPDNILVREDGTLALVDYDGMFVPSMRGQKARELGSPDFRHPSRTEDDFDEHIDDFPVISILLSLKAIAVNPDWLEKYGAADRLLLSEKDFRDISQSNVLNAISVSDDIELNGIKNIFVITCYENDLSNSFLRKLALIRPEESEFCDISTEVTEEDWENTWSDEFFVDYSADKKRLLGKNRYDDYDYLLSCMNYDLPEVYTIKYGTIVICDNAFDGLKHFFASVIIPNSVRIIGKGAFCNWQSLTSITIPKSVITICDSAFSGCEALASITLPRKVIKIGDYAFSGCYSLASIILPESVEEIGKGVFWNCSGLTSIIIPNKVKKIGPCLLSHCENLKSITVDKRNKKFDSRENCNAIISSESNVIIAGCSESFIPNSITGIGESAFEGCKGLTSITIPNSVTGIGKSAFSSCPGLTSITIPDNVTIIDNYAFSYCKSLTNIIIPDSVTSIGSGAFYDCTGLTSIIIPNSITGISKSVFSGCSGLISIIIPNSVTEIGDKAFRGCSGLTSVTIPSSVTYIGDEAFRGCSGLTSITIPSSVTHIGDEAFRDCSGLTSIIIPESVTYIGTGAFSGCSGLTSITIPESISKISRLAFEGCKAFTSIIIPDSVTCIKEGAFMNCSSLVSIVIPENVGEIERSVFAGCTSLTSLRVNKNNCFYDSRYDCNAIIDKKNNTLIAGCISTIIPFDVISIGNSAFYMCSTLTSITIPDSITKIDHFAFFGCSQLSTMKLPESVKRIGNGAFENCTGLTFFNIPPKVTSIDNETFRGCTNLTSITIPNSITSIGYMAFADCKSLVSIFIPESVKWFEQYVFSGCNKLTSIYIANGYILWYNDPFFECHSLKEIYVPEEAKSRFVGQYSRYEKLYVGYSF